MASLPMLVSRLRLELGDPAQPFQAQVESDGETDRFNLPNELLDTEGLLITLDGVPLEEADYTVDYRSGVITLSAPPADGSVLTIQGTHYETFLGEDLNTFIEGAFLRHTSGRKNAIGLPLGMEDLPPIEEYLVVILAQIDAIWAMITDAAQEIDVRSPDGITIPVGQRYQQLIGLLEMKKRQYAEMAQALNVGLHRIEMITLRRTSRTTGRLVPVYENMEYDQIAKGFMPDYGPPGTVVSVKGDRFTGTTGVTVGGVAAAEFTVVTDEHLTFVVPEGALTGHISVITPGGVMTSHYQFTVGHGIPQIHMGARQQRVFPPIDDGIV